MYPHHQGPPSLSLPSRLNSPSSPHRRDAPVPYHCQARRMHCPRATCLPDAGRRFPGLAPGVLPCFPCLLASIWLSARSLPHSLPLQHCPTRPPTTAQTPLPPQAPPAPSLGHHEPVGCPLPPARTRSAQGTNNATNLSQPHQVAVMYLAVMYPSIRKSGT